MARPTHINNEELLRIARRCFLEHGPSTPTATIAAEAGLSQAALFKRFGTKQELMVQALMPPEEPPWTARLEAGPDERPIPEQLRDVGGEMARFFIEMIPCISTMRASSDFREVLRGRYQVPPPVRGRRALQAWLDRAVAAGKVRDVDTRAAAEAFIGAMHGRAFLTYIVGEPEPPHAFVDALVDMLWYGLEPTGSP